RLERNVTDGEFPAGAQELLVGRQILERGVGTVESFGDRFRRRPNGCLDVGLREPALLLHVVGQTLLPRASEEKSGRYQATTFTTSTKAALLDEDPVRITP